MLRPAADRESYLVSACEDDETLLRDARELLAQEAIPSPEHVTARVESLLGEAAAEAVEDSEDQPSRIGPYRVLETLGRGGMGSVYLARQEKPLERDVAIKVVRGSVVDRQMLARFASETQALARMQHPNIARVFDAGRTEADLPYLVMEYVDGIPITDFCAEHRLELPERLKLFQDVCRAVHHAHQRGVIHRDLKPQPVSARPPSLAYQGRKFVRRHRVGVTAAAAVFLVLVFGAVAAGVGFVRASDEARRAQAISTFLTDMLASVRPETEASLALIIGQSYEGLGRYGEALEMIRHSAELRRRLHGPQDERLHASLYRLGTVLWKRGDLDEALASARSWRR